MFGIGFKEILLLIGVVLVIWYGGRVLQRFEAHRAERATTHDRRARRKAEAKRAAPAVEDMAECPVCGVYLAAGTSPACDRADCPYAARG